MLYPSVQTKNYCPSIIKLNFIYRAPYTVKLSLGALQRNKQESFLVATVKLLLPDNQYHIYTPRRDAETEPGLTNSRVE